MVIYLRQAGRADIARLTASPDGWETFAFDEGQPGVDIVEFDKAWHALHFMLTGSSGRSASPLGIIAGDGDMFGTDEHGLGGFSVVSPEDMASFDEALAALSDAELKARYDPEAMVAEDIYLSDVFADEGPEALDYVMQGVPALRRFAATCADKDRGAIRIIG